MKIILSAAIALLLSGHAFAHNDGYPKIDKSGLLQADAQLVEEFEFYANSIYPIDNDGDYANYQNAKNTLIEKLGEYAKVRLLIQDVDHKYFHFKRSFETIMAHLSPAIEREFETAFLVNVSYEKYGKSTAFIPSQHMRVLRKGASQRFFARDASGKVIGVANDVLGVDQPALRGLETLMPVSSGASHFGKGYVDTFSGIYRVNLKKSRTHRYQDGMIDSLYVDVNYTFGVKKKSGIAIHGTPRGNYRRLGRQASHGCVRVHQKVSKVIYKHVMRDMPMVSGLPGFGKYERLPSRFSTTKSGKRVLMIFFYGYDDDRNVAI